MNNGRGNGEWLRGQPLPSLGQAGGRSGHEPHISGNQGSWRRDRGGAANPSSFQPVNHSRKTDNSHRKQNFSSSFPRMKDCQTIEEVIQLASSCANMSPKNLSAFWSRFSHLMHSKGHGDQRERPELKGQLESILASTVKAIVWFGARDVSTTALGMAKVVSRLPSNRKGARSAFFQPLLVKCDVNATSNTFQLLANRARSLSNLDARCLSNLAYAYALVEYIPAFSNGSTLLDHIANLASDRMGEFNSQDLANMVWSYAKVQASHPRLFEQVAGTVLGRDLMTFNGQDISNTLWAFATAGETNHSLFKKVGAYLVGADLEASKPQELANIVWAYSKTKEAHPRLYKMIADSIAARKLEMFKPQELSNIVWAFATAGMHHQKLFDKVADAAIAKRSEFNAQDVSNTLWAFAVTDRAPEGLFTAFAPVATKLIEDCSAQGLSNIAWAFGVANVTTPRHLFGQRFIDAVCEKENEFNTEDLCQLHQWNLWQQELGSHTLLTEALQKRCYKAFVSGAILTSNLQKDVVRELSAIGLHPEEEVLMPSGYRLDALVEVGGKRVGIEVDGPTHFIARRPTGKTLLKRRQVARIDGVQIVSVPYWEWNRLGTKSAKKQANLSNVLGMN